MWSRDEWKRNMDLLATSIKAVWPLAAWLVITVLACGQNDAARAVWSSSHGDLVAGLPRSQMYYAGLALAFIAACFVIGAKASIDGARARHASSPQLDGELYWIPTVLVSTLVSTLLVTSHRGDAGEITVLTFLAIYLPARFLTATGLIPEPQSRWVLLAIGASVVLAAYLRREDGPAITFTAVLLLSAEMVIGVIRWKVGRWRSRMLVVAVVAAILAAYVYVDQVPDRVVKQACGLLSAAVAGIVALYAATLSGIRYRKYLCYAVGCTLLAVGIYHGVGIVKGLSIERAFVTLVAAALPIIAGLAIPFTTTTWRASTHLLVSLALVAFVVVAAIVVVAFGRTVTVAIGAVAIALFAFGAWGALAIYLFVYLPRVTGQFRWTALAVSAVLVAHQFDGGGVQTLPENNVDDERETLEAFVRKRVQDHPAPTYYVVAAAGGGLRAAAHTTQVMEQLDVATCGEFSRRLLAVSSVSGGSLGATSFLLSPDRDDPTGGCDADRAARHPANGHGARDPVRGRHAAQFMRRDFSSNAIAYLLFPGVVHSIVPFAFSQADRGRALSSDWEQSWEDMAGAGTFAEPLLETRLGAVGSTALLLNTTSVANGDRVVIGNKRANYIDAVDFFELAPRYRDIQASEAVLNSARFPVVSPAARIWTTSEDSLAAWRYGKLLEHQRREHAGHPGSEHSGDRARISRKTQVARGTLIRDKYMADSPRVLDHLVDGGYFENSGAESLLEVLPAIRSQLPPSARLRVLLIHNSPVVFSGLVCETPSDDYLTVDIPFRDESGEGRIVFPGDREVRGFAEGARSGSGANAPINAVLNAREARGRSAIRRLVRALVPGAACDHVEESYFAELPGNPSPPLSWYIDAEMHLQLVDSAKALVQRVRSNDPSLFPGPETP